MENLNAVIAILSIILALFLLRIVLTYAFQRSNFNAYREALRKGDTDKATSRGRSYYLSLSKKTRKKLGINDIVQIDTKVHEDVAEQIMRVKILE